MKRFDLNRRLSKLEEATPPGQGGWVPAHIILPNADGSPATGPWPLVWVDDVNAKRHMIPLYDDRFQNPDGTDKEDAPDLGPDGDPTRRFGVVYREEPNE